MPNSGNGAEEAKLHLMQVSNGENLHLKPPLCTPLNMLLLTSIIIHSGHVPMPRKYERKKEHQALSQDMMEEAVTLVMAGESIRAVAEMKGR